MILPASARFDDALRALAVETLATVCLGGERRGELCGADVALGVLCDGRLDLLQRTVLLACGEERLEVLRRCIALEGIVHHILHGAEPGLDVGGIGRGRAAGERLHQAAVDSLIRLALERAPVRGRLVGDVIDVASHRVTRGGREHIGVEVCQAALEVIPGDRRARRHIVHDSRARVAGRVQGLGRSAIEAWRAGRIEGRAIECALLLPLEGVLSAGRHRIVVEERFHPAQPLRARALREIERDAGAGQGIDCRLAAFGERVADRLCDAACNRRDDIAGRPRERAELGVAEPAFARGDRCDRALQRTRAGGGPERRGIRERLGEPRGARELQRLRAPGDRAQGGHREGDVARHIAGQACAGGHERRIEAARLIDVLLDSGRTRGTLTRRGLRSQGIGCVRVELMQASSSVLVRFADAGEEVLTAAPERDTGVEVGSVRVPQLRGIPYLQRVSAEVGCGIDGRGRLIDELIAAVRDLPGDFRTS